MARSWGRFEQPGSELYADDTRNGIINPTHWDPTRANVLDRRGNELLPVLRHHHEIDAGVDRLRAAPLRTAGHLLDAVPIANDHTVEAKLSLEHVGDEVPVAVHLAPALARSSIGEAGIANHDGLHICSQRTVISGAVRAGEICLAGPRFALVDAMERTAVADPVLRGRQDRSGCAELALQPANDRFTVAANQFGVRTIAFIRAAPAGVLHDGEGRGEGPADAGRTDLLRSRTPDAFDQLRIVRC